MMNHTVYKTEVSIKGGSNAHLSSADAAIDLDLRLPQELGGPGGATNAEQLFAAAFAACFSSALAAAAAEGTAKLADSPEINAEVELAKSDTGAYQMAVNLRVHLNGMAEDQAQALITRAREIWPWRSVDAVNLTVNV